MKTLVPDPRIYTADGARSIGYGLGLPGDHSLHPEFEQDAEEALERGRIFGTARTPYNLDHSIDLARTLYRPAAPYIGTATGNALKGLFWTAASQYSRVERQSNQRAAYGAKAQRHLSMALYRIETADQKRLLHLGLDAYPLLDQDWTQVFRGAQAVAQVARALHSSGIPTILPVSFIHRRYAIDLFCSVSKVLRFDVCLQVKSIRQPGMHLSLLYPEPSPAPGMHLDIGILAPPDSSVAAMAKAYLGKKRLAFTEHNAHSGDVVVRIGNNVIRGWNRSATDQALAGERMSVFNRDYDMECIPAFAGIALPNTPPYVPDPGPLAEHVRHFLEEVA